MEKKLTTITAIEQWTLHFECAFWGGGKKKEKKQRSCFLQ